LRQNENIFGVYIHWPYCIKKCLYCSFNSYAVSNPPDDELVSAVLSHYESEKSRYSGKKAVSVYFGGGTPSLMPPRHIERILERISRDFVLENSEITLEVNPGTVTAEKIKDFRSAGINRLSIGVQSFNDEVLEFLGRPHSVKEALAVIDFSRNAGFSNLGVDLIIGPLPQTDERLVSDLQFISEIGPEFVSAYMLSIEDGTPFARRRDEGAVLSRSEEEICDQYEMTCRMLEEYGIRQYEISNFARPGFEAVHNSLYWNGSEYMGLGPGAHGFYYNNRYVSAVRYSCLNEPHSYIGAAEKSCSFRQSQESLDSVTLARELIFCGLRTNAGLRLELLKNRFGLDLLCERSEAIKKYTDSGWLELCDTSNGEILRLTASGRLFADEISIDFF